jgi:hypothetical protein
MYELHNSNFFYLHSRIAIAGFWYIGFINNISNLHWLQLRFSSINKYELSFFLFKTRILKECYLNVAFHNRSIAIFSKFYNYFFTTKIYEDNFLLLEKDYSNIKIKCYAFFYLKHIIYLSTFYYYNKNSILSFFIPFSLKISNSYKWINKYEIVFKELLYYFFYKKMIFPFLIYNSIINKFFYGYH